MNLGVHVTKMERAVTPFTSGLDGGEGRSEKLKNTTGGVNKKIGLNFWAFFNNNLYLGYLALRHKRKAHSVDITRTVTL